MATAAGGRAGAGGCGGGEDGGIDGGGSGGSFSTFKPQNVFQVGRAIGKSRASSFLYTILEYM